jgi:type IV pilus assembly protein PilP
MAFISFPAPGTAFGAKSSNVSDKDLSAPTTPNKISLTNLQDTQVQNPEKIEISKLSLDEPFSYNPRNRIDPFKPFLQKILPRLRRAKQALPLTPLQKLSKTELQNGLVAIIWGQLGKRALVQDSSGKGYIVQQGTPVGQNGIVKQILPECAVSHHLFKVAVGGSYQPYIHFCSCNTANSFKFAFLQQS